MKKRVGIITFLHNDNYGSILQAWALQHTLEELGLETVHLDYCPSSVEKIRNLMVSGNSPRLLTEGLRKREVRAREEAARKKHLYFASFRKENLHTTIPCADKAALSRVSRGLDALIAGSDQIWSPVWMNPVYFLNFAGNCHRVAYAPSLGVSVLPGKAKAAWIGRLISRFDAVSVREEEGAALVERMTGHRPPVMPDPVLLQTKEEWLSLAELPPEEEPYLLCYFIGENPDYWQETERLARETGLKVQVIPVAADAYSSPWDKAEGLSPRQWLGSLAGADLVLTDSFHGACFAALLGRPLKVLRRYHDGDRESKNSRVDQLMRSLGLESWEQYDPQAAVPYLSQLRERGRKYLLDALLTSPADGQAPAAEGTEG